MKRLFLDDERSPVSGDWDIARNSNEFVNAILSNSYSVMSFDHDLGLDSEDGNWCIHYLVDAVLDGKIDVSGLREIIFHTANNIGIENMRNYVVNAQQHIPMLAHVEVTLLPSTSTRGHAKMDS